MRLDVLYIKGKTSINNDLELKYSLRSLEEYGYNYRRVFITGECPDFIDKKKVIYTPAEDIGCPMINHWWKVTETIKRTDISTNFVLMYDDIFFKCYTNISQTPMYIKGKLKDATNGGERYRENLKNAERWLQEQGYETYDFEVHRPIVYNRLKFLKLEKIFAPLKKEQVAMAVRSIYGNMYAKMMIKTPDVKIREADERVDNLNTDCFSVSDKAFSCHVQEWLEKEFPKKGRYER